MDDDTKLRREIHAALAMQALLEGFSSLAFLSEEGRIEEIRKRAKTAVQAADAVIAELGPLE